MHENKDNWRLCLSNIFYSSSMSRVALMRVSVTYLLARVRFYIHFGFLFLAYHLLIGS